MKTIFEKVTIELSSEEVHQLKETSKALRALAVTMRHYRNEDVLPQDLKQKFHKFDRCYLDGVLYEILQFSDGVKTNED